VFVVAALCKIMVDCKRLYSKLIRGSRRAELAAGAVINRHAAQGRKVV
jgi:hypothetical protein